MPNKQHDARAASFKRIAKDIRALTREQLKEGPPVAKKITALIAKALNTEAMRLLALR